MAACAGEETKAEGTQKYKSNNVDDQKPFKK